MLGERGETEGGEAQEAGGVGYGSDRAVGRAPPLTVGFMSLVVLWTSLSATKMGVKYGRKCCEILGNQPAVQPQVKYT